MLTVGTIEMLSIDSTSIMAVNRTVAEASRSW
jgi:hypothetical protein